MSDVLADVHDPAVCMVCLGWRGQVPLVVSAMHEGALAQRRVVDAVLVGLRTAQGVAANEHPRDPSVTTG